MKGRTAADTYAVQLEAKAVNLNSGDCFLLLTPEDGVVYAWLGRGANAGEKEAATALAEWCVDSVGCACVWCMGSRWRRGREELSSLI